MRVEKAWRGYNTQKGCNSINKRKPGGNPSSVTNTNRGRERIMERHETELGKQFISRIVWYPIGLQFPEDYNIYWDF